MENLKPTETGMTAIPTGASEVTIPRGATATLHELQSPVIPVPSFVTPQWVRLYLTITRQDLRIFHTEGAEFLRKVSGFPWPMEKPDVDRTYELIVEGLRYPFFMAAFQAFYGARKRTGRRKRSMLTRLYGDFIHAFHRLETDNHLLSRKPSEFFYPKTLRRLSLKEGTKILHEPLSCWIGA